MRTRVDTPLRIGNRIIAAVAEQKAVLEQVGAAVVGTGTKRPLVILHILGDVVTALDIGGQVHDADEVELRYPGAIEHFRAQIAEMD